MYARLHTKHLCSGGISKSSTVNVGGGGGDGGNGGRTSVFDAASVDAACGVVGAVSVLGGTGGGVVDELLLVPVVCWFAVSLSGAGGDSVAIVDVGGIADSLLADSGVGCVSVGESN